MPEIREVRKEYGDWCVDFYNRDCPNLRQNRGIVVAGITEKLLKRLNYLTGRNYGNKSFDDCYVKYLSEKEMQNLECAREAERDELIRKGEMYLKKKERLQARKDALPNDTFQAKKKGIDSKIGKLKDKYDELEETIYHEPLGKNPRFQNVSEEELRLFELLLMISEGDLRRIRNDEWEVVDEKIRQEMISIMWYVGDNQNFELDEWEIEEIVYKLSFPLSYRLHHLQKRIQEDQSLKEDASVTSTMEKIGRLVNKLYKTVMSEPEELYDDLSEESMRDYLERIISEVYKI